MATKKEQVNIPNEPLPGEEMPPDPDFRDGEVDPNEPVFGAMQVDAQRFVKMDAIGSTFTGKYLRLVDPRDKDKGTAKHPGYLFAEYPTGRVVVLPFNWSIGEEIAKKERTDPKFFEANLVRLTLVNVIPKPNDTSVKLYGYQYAALPKGFRVQWDETFPS